MLKRMKLKNFKCWEDTSDIVMSPLTLFFGTNSSGKSSIGQFLMLLKQTVESSDRRNVLNTSGKDLPVELGTFNDLLHNRDSNNVLEFSYSWEVSDYGYLINGKNPHIKRILNFEAKISQGSNRQPLLKEFMYHQDDIDRVFNLESYGMHLLEDNIYKFVSKPEVNNNNSNGKLLPVRFYGFPGELIDRSVNLGFSEDINQQHEQLFHKLYYLGPLRTRTSRRYFWNGFEPDRLGYEGEDTIPALLSATKKRIDFGVGEKQYSFKEVIAKELKNMGLIEEFEVKEVSELRQEYEVKVKTKGSSRFVDLPDVGFGVSQVLPVLVHLFYTPINSTIFMEQPELHLHPSAQSALADVMIDALRSRENGIDRNIQLIIETHSEHFLRRLQRRLAEEKLKQSDLAVYFADVTKSPAKLEALRINEYGIISNWPENFFGDEMGDLLRQSEAAIRRKQNNE